MTKRDKLTDLVSVGPAMLAVFEDLGITEIDHLRDKDARELFERLHEIRGQRIDPCVEDIFSATIAQARNPNLPREKRDWFYWSKVRKSKSS